MNVRMGSQTFVDVTIPVLWGTRAILQRPDGALSVLDLAGERAKPEILGDRPAPGVAYLPQAGGFRILGEGNQTLYVYEPERKRLTGVELRLPEVEVTPNAVRVGSNSFRGNVIAGCPVGIAVSETSITLGAELPPGLTMLGVPSPALPRTHAQ